MDSTRPAVKTLVICPHKSNTFLLLFGYFFFARASSGKFACNIPAVARSPILPLAAAITAVAIGASPALASPLSAGKRDDAQVVAFPLLAVKGQGPAGFGYSANHSSHQSHESHVSGGGGGGHSSHYSHDSHYSHTSSVPGPAPSSVVSAAPSQNLGSAGVASGPPSGAAPSQSALQGSPVLSGSGSPAVSGNGSPPASNGGGCAFVVFAPFGAAAKGIKRLVRRRRSR
jgi:hypothetical protein